MRTRSNGFVTTAAKTATIAMLLGVSPVVLGTLDVGGGGAARADDDGQGPQGAGQGGSGQGHGGAEIRVAKVIREAKGAQVTIPTVRVHKRADLQAVAVANLHGLRKGFPRSSLADLMSRAPLIMFWTGHLPKP